MLKHLLLLSTILGLSACTSAFTEEALKIKEESLEAVDNLKIEAVELQEEVSETLNQVEEAKNSVVHAVDAVNEANEDLKAIGD